MRSKEEVDQSRPEIRGRGGGVLLGCLRLHYECFETDISHILELQNFFLQRQLYYYLLDSGCVQEPVNRASLTCAASMTFLLQKTPGNQQIFRLSSKTGLHKKRTMHFFISFMHKWIRDLPFVIGCLTANPKTGVPSP